MADKAEKAGQVEGSKARDTRLTFDVSKVDSDRRLVFGFASVAVKADGTLPHDSQGM